MSLGPTQLISQIYFRTDKEQANSQHRGQILIPLPSVQTSVYCIFEDLIWITWLTIKTNWPVILVWAVIVMTIYVILKYQGTRSLIRIRQQRDEEILRLLQQRVDHRLINQPGKSNRINKPC